MTVLHPRRRAARVLTTGLLGLMLELGAASSAVAADEPYGDDEVTISVTISELDLCVRGLPGCQPNGDGVLGLTGLQVATPLGLGVLFVAFGLGTYALARRRVSSPPKTR